MLLFFRFVYAVQTISQCKADIQLQLVLVSIIGRFARVIQAHVSLEEQRLKVRYSQLYDFENCSQRQMDLFLRWTLSSPLLEPKPQAEDNKAKGSSNGDTAAQLTVWNVQTKDCKTSYLRDRMETLNLAS